jgi:hypothetical protein
MGLSRQFSGGLTRQTSGGAAAAAAQAAAAAAAQAQAAAAAFGASPVVGGIASPASSAPASPVLLSASGVGAGASTSGASPLDLSSSAFQLLSEPSTLQLLSGTPASPFGTDMSQVQQQMLRMQSLLQQEEQGRMQVLARMAATAASDQTASSGFNFDVSGSGLSSVLAAGATGLTSALAATAASGVPFGSLATSAAASSFSFGSFDASTSSAPGSGFSFGAASSAPAAGFAGTFAAGAGGQAESQQQPQAALSPPSQPPARFRIGLPHYKAFVNVVLTHGVLSVCVPLLASLSTLQLDPQNSSQILPALCRLLKAADSLASRCPLSSARSLLPCSMRASLSAALFVLLPLRSSSVPAGLLFIADSPLICCCDFGVG